MHMPHAHAHARAHACTCTRTCPYVHVHVHVMCMCICVCACIICVYVLSQHVCIAVRCSFTCAVDVAGTKRRPRRLGRRERARAAAAGAARRDGLTLRSEEHLRTFLRTLCVCRSSCFECFDESMSGNDDGDVSWCGNRFTFWGAAGGLAFYRLLAVTFFPCKVATGPILLFCALRSAMCWLPMGFIFWYSQSAPGVR
jgi:hypothetical protein